MTEKEIEEKLIEYEPLFKYMAYRIKLDGYLFDDIVQELRMEFVKALGNFEKDKNTELKTYFIKYQKMWLNRKLEKQNAYKRPNIDYTLNKQIFVDGKKTTLLERLTDDHLYPNEISELQGILEFLLETLDTYKYGYITKMYILDEMTLKEVGDAVGISHQAVSIHNKKNLERLKKALENYNKVGD